MIAAVVALVMVGAGGVYLVTKDDDSGDVLPRETDTTDTTDSTDGPDDSAGVTGETSATTVVVQSTAAPVTVVIPTTVAPSVSTIAPVPDGAVDLGLGVYFPLPEGWEITDDSDAPTISNGTTSISLQALSRPPGEEPQSLLQEYVDTFDADFEAIAYTPGEQLPRLEGTMPIDEYGITYRIYAPDQDDGISITGLAGAFIRADGLSVIFDLFSSSEEYAIGGDSYATFTQSMLDAPALDEPVTLEPREPFRITSIHEFVPAFGLAGYTVTPGWTVYNRPDGNPMVSNDDGDFEMRRFEAVGSADGAVEAAKAHQLAMYPNITHDPTVVGVTSAAGHDRRDVNWTGTLTDGRAISGVFSIFFDPSTGNAVALYQDWYGAVANPYPSEFGFMFTSASHSFTTI